MDSPRSGFRRAAAASWALMGLGVAGVAGASALAYADTVKPPPKAPIVAVDPAPPELIPSPILAPPPPPDVPATTVDPPPMAAETPVQQTPEYTPAPQYTPEPQYTPVPQHTPVPEYTTQAPKPTTLPTTKRRLAPTTVMAPNYSPQITISRGS
ncbi:hypothetical protein [Mycolicibacterium hodleri]|uniref:Uncharacterized protein n=1 Tax=Mycolicibacterium hodleri TaxID=49897 RepID=A0A502E760_9MYCO|nr:hypothetical protein [Mycolicibacterium hodleri]TPG32682.1 hypothetical protein EAH80_17875 [Mycolicibacterium hodleri]